jgi:alkanesulfonate monooxygenase SsuD/methylene tetrahydromethanopterin reductase-like flavin-dependent oxidoreductase (luciferase family)
LIVGVGPGAIRKTGSLDFELMGVDRSEKYERTREYVDVMRRIWTDAEPSYEGKFVSFPPVEIYPKPLQDPYPPLWMAAHAKRGEVTRGMENVAEFADGWFIGGADAKSWADALSEMRALARAKGRTGQIRAVKESSACVARSSEAARSAAIRTLEARVGHSSVMSNMEIALRTSLIGSPEELQDRIAQYEASGITHVELKFIYQTIDHLIEQMTLWSEEIASRFSTTDEPLAAGTALT